jgi:hypothetical protein
MEEPTGLFLDAADTASTAYKPKGTTLIWEREPHLRDILFISMGLRFHIGFAKHW